jgi:hypothetical protein
MGNKTPPPPARQAATGSFASTTSGGSQPNFSAASNAAPGSGASSVLLRCPACTRTVRPPPGAARFRCPCGRILAQPAAGLSLTSSAPALSAPLPSQTRSIPPSTPSNQAPIQSMTRSIPPQPNAGGATISGQPPMRVRCPSCQQILLAPNARTFIANCQNEFLTNILEAQFQCPCGQMLRRPGPVQQPAGPPRLRVRCPRCATILEAPPNARVFQCRCGIHLAPPTGGVSSRALPTFSNDASDALAGLSLAASALKSANVGNWRRRVVGDKLGWRKLFSEQDEALVMDAEEAVMEQISYEGLADVPVAEIKQKLTRLGIDTRTCVEKKDLISKTIAAPNELAFMHEEPVLRRKLEERGIDPTVCQSNEDLAARLFAFEWSDGKTTQCIRKDGFVRVLAAGSTLVWGNAYDFLLPMSSPQRADEIWRLSSESFMTKAAWFRAEMNKLRVPWESGHIKVVVRRNEVLQDGFHRMINLPPSDMHKYFRYEFSGEPGVDAGGIAREWFSLTSDASFNVDLGLFEYGGTDNVCYQISPNSELANENHLLYFKFFGRLLGRALFESQHIGAHLTRVMYKHLLAWPIVEADLEYIDPEVANSFKQIREMPDVSVLSLDFTTTVSVFGDNQELELKPGGRDIEVTNENKDEFLELRLKSLCMDRVAPQLYHLLVGFYEVVPMELLSVFDFNEIELLLCGLPKISVDDWKMNTMYRGEYEAMGPLHPVVKMFWDIIAECNDEQRAKFLQFATGTSRVPVQGFCALQGNDGNVKPFTIDSISIQDSVYPRAHTCFNRIDLPNYASKEEMRFRMMQALQLEGVGFQIE